MTDEEMADKYYDSKFKSNESHFSKSDIEQAFLAGLKAGRPEWHDLRKDPKDLPEDTYDVLDQAGYKVHYNFFQNVWVNEKDEIDIQFHLF
jgi:hypothetical protein